MGYSRVGRAQDGTDGTLSQTTSEPSRGGDLPQQWRHLVLVAGEAGRLVLAAQSLDDGAQTELSGALERPQRMVRRRA